MKILVCFGTRPEAVKMAPICRELERRSIPFKICVTAQHRQMLDQVLSFFDLKPDYDLDLMQQRQSLNNLSSNIFSEIDEVFEDFEPDIVMVQGDTTTAFCIAMAAFYRQIKVAHIEAGLRTYNKFAPYPEEVNRQIISRIANYHFAPTQRAAENLLAEKISKESIVVSGNTVIDSLEMAEEKLKKTLFKDSEIQNLKHRLNPKRKLILVTGHRRENFGEGLKNICEALLEIANNGDVDIVYPVHMNPIVRKPVFKLLNDHPGIFLIDPVSYPVFIWLMKKADIIISDSGGVQEEAPSFKKPVVVTREFTERMESVKKGISFLVGTQKEKIVQTVRTLLESPYKYLEMDNPYGDGKAAKNIIDFLVKVES